MHNILRLGILLVVFLTNGVHGDSCITSSGLITCPDDCCWSQSNRYCCDDDDDDDDDDHDTESDHYVMGPGTIIGITVGVLVVIAVLAALIFLCFCLKARKGKKGTVIRYHSNQTDITFPGAPGYTSDPVTYLGAASENCPTYDNSRNQATEVSSHHVVPLGPPPPYTETSENTYNALYNVDSHCQHAPMETKKPAQHILMNDSLHFNTKDPSAPPKC